MRYRYVTIFSDQLAANSATTVLKNFYAEDFTDAEIDAIFNKVYGGTNLTKEEILKFKSAIMVQFALMDHQKGWTQQLHYGPIRDNNSRLFAKIGPRYRVRFHRRFKCCKKYEQISQQT